MNKKNNAKKTVLLVLRLQNTKGKRETSAILVRSRHCNRECSVIDVTVERWEDHGIMLILESGNLPFLYRNQDSRSRGIDRTETLLNGVCFGMLSAHFGQKAFIPLFCFPDFP